MTSINRAHRDRGQLLLNTAGHLRKTEHALFTTFHGIHTSRSALLYEFWTTVCSTVTRGLVGS